MPSLVCAQDINVSKEKHSEKSSHQHVLCAWTAMIQTRRRLECFRMCGGSHRAAGETKCLASPHHIEADPAVESLGNSCATGLYLVFGFFALLFTRVQLHLHKCSIFMQHGCMSVLIVTVALQLPLPSRDWDPTFLISRHRKSSCLPHCVSHCVSHHSFFSQMSPPVFVSSLIVFSTLEMSTLSLSWSSRAFLWS